MLMHPPWLWSGPAAPLADAFSPAAESGCRVVLLLDDDLLTPRSLIGLPWGYCWRLWRGMTRHRLQLSCWFSELWVSTEPLKRQCQQVTDLPVQVLPLQPSQLVIEPPKLFRIAYLGTTSHQQELAWLVGLFRQLQLRRTDCLLEVVVNRRWRKVFAGIPRVKCCIPPINKPLSRYGQPPG